MEEMRYLQGSPSLVPVTPNKAFRWVTSSTAVPHPCSCPMSTSPQVTVLSPGRHRSPQAAPGSSDGKALVTGPTAANYGRSMCNSFVTWTVAYLLRVQRSCPNHHSLESDRAAPGQHLRLVQTSRRENTNLFTQ